MCFAIESDVYGPFQEHYSGIKFHVFNLINHGSFCETHTQNLRYYYSLLAVEWLCWSIYFVGFLVAPRAFWQSFRCVPGTLTHVLAETHPCVPWAVPCNKRKYTSSLLWMDVLQASTVLSSNPSPIFMKSSEIGTNTRFVYYCIPDRKKVCGLTLSFVGNDCRHNCWLDLKSWRGWVYHPHPNQKSCPLF